MSDHAASQLKRITVVTLGEGLQNEGATYLIEQMRAVRYRDAYQLCCGQGEVWLFDYGVLVGWNLPETDRLQLCNKLSAWVASPYDRPLLDQYSYRIHTEQRFEINHDCIELPDGEPLKRLALSHAFAQAATLEVFEEKAQKIIQDNAYLSRELAKTGKIPLGRSELAKLRGRLFDTSSDITLHFNLLDTPEFFWEYPEVEEYYQRLAKYLDLNARLAVLDKKLGTIHNLLDMLAAEQNHKHSAFLEWIIIVLIAIDIVIYFV